MNLSVSMPLDNDGFLRRECPNRDREFKWHHGPASEEAESHTDPEAYTCPLCGQPAGPGTWWTREQLDYIHGAAAPAVQQVVQDELDQAFKGHNSRFIKVKSTSSSALPAGPMPLTEPDDMVIIASPCHAYEPVKVPEDAAGPFYCLVCGARFAV